MSNLASAVDELLAVDVRQAPAAQLQDEVADILRERNRLDAAYLERVEAIDRRRLLPDDQVSTQAWLRNEMRLSPGASHRDVGLARDLADALPLTGAAMADGDVSLPHAQQIAGLRRIITDSALGKVEPHLVALARERRPDQLRGTLLHVKHAYAPDRGVKDEQDLHAERELSLATTFHGAGVGRWTLPPASQEAVATAIHAASVPEADDTRTPAQRRADALVTIAEIAMRSGELAITGGVKPHISLIIPAELAAEPLQPRPLPTQHFDNLDAIEAELRGRAVHTSYGAVISP